MDYKSHPLGGTFASLIVWLAEEAGHSNGGLPRRTRKPPKPGNKPPMPSCIFAASNLKIRPPVTSQSKTEPDLPQNQGKIVRRSVGEGQPDAEGGGFLT